MFLAVTAEHRDVAARQVLRNPRRDGVRWRAGMNSDGKPDWLEALGETEAGVGKRARLVRAASQKGLIARPAVDTV
jgi:hypothetical protein